MDAAPLRGEPTVHENWDINTEYFPVDTMLITAYQLFENYEAAKFRLFIGVQHDCPAGLRGDQQYDIDFENGMMLLCPNT
jgi:geranylgeranyl diphosphate synthase type II